MQFFYYRWCGCGDSAMCFVIACIAIFKYCQIWQYSLGHILCTIDISLPKTRVLAHFGNCRNIETMPFQLFEFHIGNKYVWIPFLEKIPFSNRQNIRKDLFG